jgi:predicted enzyme related to lactoylglutathione lyase
MADVQVPPGRFVWYDLMTTDPGRARSFYGELMGWIPHHRDFEGGQSYTMFQCRDSMLGGMVSMDPAQGVPPHWIAYVTVDDVDAAATLVPRLGGRIVQEPTDLPGTGRFAVIQDPDGAAISLFRHDEGELPETTSSGEGAFCWNELLSEDPQRSLSFYGQLVGWEHRELPMGHLGTYWILTSAGVDVAGLLQRPATSSGPPCWLSYITVEDVDDRARAIQLLGGRVVAPPSDIPGIGRFAVCLDPLGAVFAIFREQEG